MYEQRQLRLSYVAVWIMSWLDKIFVFTQPDPRGMRYRRSNRHELESF